MSEAEDVLARVDTLIRIGLRLALSTATGRIALVTASEAIDESWIPGPWRDSLGTALARAADARPQVLAFSEIEKILTSAWGVRRVRDELDALEPAPAAVTPTSQVHRGVREGSPVAVKVLRPGLASAVRQDLALLDTLLAPLRGAFPGLDPGALLAELRERTLDEFDLENEAAVMRRFGRALRAGPVAVPVPVGDLCRETVLVSSWLDGTALGAAVGSGHDRSAAALLQFVIGGIREGLVHCDLNLRDVLVLEDGRLGVVDFGAVAVVGRERADLGLALVSAYTAGDPHAMDAALSGLGLMTPGHGELALSTAGRVLGELGGAGESRLDVAAVSAAAARLEEVPEAVIELILAGRLAPGDLWPARGLAQLFSLIARIGASGIWRDQVAAALRHGWQA